MSGKVWHWLCGLLFPQLGLEKKKSLPILIFFLDDFQIFGVYTLYHYRWGYSQKAYRPGDYNCYHLKSPNLEYLQNLVKMKNSRCMVIR